MISVFFFFNHHDKPLKLLNVFSFNHDTFLTSHRNHEICFFFFFLTIREVNY